MPTRHELVPNKPLPGADLAEIIKADVAAVLAGDCFLTPFIAYQRCSYEVRVTLHMDNPSTPKTVAVAKSKPIADDKVEADPRLAAVEVFPLTRPSAEDVVQSTERSRVIDSPNAARVAYGIPIDVITRDNNGAATERKVLYPADYPGADTPEATDTDVTASVRTELGMPPEPESVEVPQP
jgi:hypothetical protein